MRNMIFTVKSHPKKDSLGVTVVSDLHFLENDVEQTVLMGELTKKRGEDGYRALVLVEKELVKIPGLFSTRSKAGHAVRKAFEKDIRSTKTATKRTVRIVSEQDKRDKRNARRREQRAAAKKAA